jgi:hypothetical protein
MLVTSALAALIYFVAAGFLMELLPEASAWSFSVLAILAILNCGFAIALWRWKRWGFWGYCCTTLAAFAINLSIGTGLGPSLWGLMGIVILLAALHVGRHNEGWSQLE